MLARMKEGSKRIPNEGNEGMSFFITASDCDGDVDTRNFNGRNPKKRCGFHRREPMKNLDEFRFQLPLHGPVLLPKEQNAGRVKGVRHRQV